MSSKRMVDPSDIIVETIESTQTQITHVNPWVRCVARFFDYALFFTVLSLGHRFLPWDPIPQGLYAKVIPIEFLLWVPVEAALLCSWGSTPGKWFLKTTLKRRDLKPLDFTLMLRRSFSVWVRGLGLAIPGVNILCLLVAYQRLLIVHVASWDRELQMRLTHYPLARWRLPFALFTAIGGLSAYYARLI